jgi:tetratricopeptide (TPR) repeat protein
VGYSAQDVAQLLGVSLRQINAFVRAGFLAPATDTHGRAQFSFQDVVLLRTAQGLVGADIAPARVKRALAKLKQQLPDGKPLTGVSIAAEGNRIVVRDGRTRWNPESGQALFDFRVEELAKDAAALTDFKPRAQKDGKVGKSRGKDGAGENANAAGDYVEDWYGVGCAREDEGDRDGAIAAYKRALNADETHVDAHINLGRMLHERGETPQAVRHYERALDLRPGDAIAAFNLGVALEDQERLDEAAHAYLQAVATDPRSADAHYNLAGVYERMGDRAGAIRHLRAYKQLTRR